MLAYPLLVINIFLVLLNTAFCSVIICLTAIIKLMLPTKSLKLYATKMANMMMWLWATLNLQLLSLSNHVEWDIQGGDSLHKGGWYLMISNHISWADIVVLCSVFKDKIPMPKFFLKYQLLYVPFIGMSCWALNMPFMRRYSRGYLIRHPEKRGQDLETTRRSCAKFKHIPTTVVNYVEGTRFTPDKQPHKSEYDYLLPPKSGGIAYTLAAMGELYENVIDVTLAYPENPETPFKDMLMGKMKRIVVHIEVLPVDEQVRGDYFNDKPYKRQFQKWLANIWKQKDQRLQKIYQGTDD